MNVYRIQNKNAEPATNAETVTSCGICKQIIIYVCSTYKYTVAKSKTASGTCKMQAKSFKGERNPRNLTFEKSVYNLRNPFILTRCGVRDKIFVCEDLFKDWCLVSSHLHAKVYVYPVQILTSSKKFSRHRLIYTMYLASHILIIRPNDSLQFNLIRHLPIQYDRSISRNNYPNLANLLMLQNHIISWKMIPGWKYVY